MSYNAAKFEEASVECDKCKDEIKDEEDTFCYDCYQKLKDECEKLESTNDTLQRENAELNEQIADLQQQIEDIDI